MDLTKFSAVSCDSYRPVAFSLLISAPVDCHKRRYVLTISTASPNFHV